MSPEVEAIESALGCVIEGIEGEQVLLRFSHLDAANPDRECSLVLNVAQGYKGAQFLYFLACTFYFFPSRYCLTASAHPPFAAQNTQRNRRILGLCTRRQDGISDPSRSAFLAFSVFQCILM